MSQCLKIFVLITIFFALFAPYFQSIGVSDDTGVSLQVTGVPVCDNDGVCETGETTSNCPSDCPAPTPAPTPGGIFLPDTSPPIIYNLFISRITVNSAEIFWKTNENALCQLFWGKTQEYEAEAISEDTFYLEHSTKLINLSPETMHHFKISCRDTNRNESETGDQKFTTLSLPDITPPANVSNFEAIPGDSQITLTWQNPPDPDFKAVKIMRSEKFYPISPDEGVPVYNDKGNSFVDTGLTNGKRYYYTAFAYDKAGNYSSGAVASAVPQKPGVPPIVPPPPPEVIPPVAPPPEVEKINLEDFDFIQEGEKLSLIEKEKIKINIKDPLTVSIDYEKVPEVLKTIMVTLKKDERTFSFLLRINKGKTRYEAIILPPEPGIYPLTLTILDYKNQTLKRITGYLVIEGPPIPPPIPWYQQYRLYQYLFVLILLGIALGIIVYWYQKLKKKPIKKPL